MVESNRDLQPLLDCLHHEPRELKFGTSGRRGLVVDLTQLEVYINTRAELEYLKSLPASVGGIVPGDEFYFAHDLRPSSYQFVPEADGRGEIAQAVEHAIRDSGMVPVNLGRIPTPALTFHATSRCRGSIMVTGSHIPFDRNGYKANTSQGELLKHHEEPITAMVRSMREQICQQPIAASLFDADGMFKSGHAELSAESDAARIAYLERYVSFWPNSPLRGMRLLFYQHSAVGRDLVPEILKGLGAEVFPAGRSEEFVPIDTENIDTAQLAAIQSLADHVQALHGRVEAVISTDGDSDRPLILGVDPASGLVRFHPGDLVGMAVADYLEADAVVVPISCNDAIDRGALASVVEPKTRIGSPYVIAGMEAARQRGKRIICGWEANGGFLLGSDIERDGQTLRALPTRDAVLPIVGVLVSARLLGLSINELFARFPQRFSRAALMKNLPKAKGAQMVRMLSPTCKEISAVEFGSGATLVTNAGKQEVLMADSSELELIRDRLSSLFRRKDGFSQILGLNYLDGVRITFDNGEVAHLRPSGNADEFRVYAVADTAARAEAMVAACLDEPYGIVRRLEIEVLSESSA